MSDLMLTFLIGITSGGFTFIGVVIQTDRKNREKRAAEDKERDKAKELINAELNKNFRLMVLDMMKLSLATAHSLIDNNGKRAVREALADLKDSEKGYREKDTEYSDKLAALL